MFAIQFVIVLAFFRPTIQHKIAVETNVSLTIKSSLPWRNLPPPGGGEFHAVSIGTTMRLVYLTSEV